MLNFCLPKYSKHYPRTPFEADHHSCSKETSRGIGLYWKILPHLAKEPPAHPPFFSPGNLRPSSIAIVSSLLFKVAKHRRSAPLCFLYLALEVYIPSPASNAGEPQVGAGNPHQ